MYFDSNGKEEINFAKINIARNLSVATLKSDRMFVSFSESAGM